jgi:glycosyltransferase involved in cell wall biosynthesis
MRITVAIATWNRAKLLDQTLESFHRLRVPAGTRWEAIVVDNNSTDDTQTVIARHAKSLPLRGVFEPTQGVSYAKNRAVRATTGDLMLWTDDDVILDEGWLAAYHDAALAWPKASFFGGTIEPLYESTPPRWIAENVDLVRGPLVVCNPGSELRPVRADECPYGASMAFRSDVFDELTFNTRLGRKGEGQVRGEETEVLERLQQSGRLGVWVPTARVRHHVPTARMTERYIWEWNFASGIGTVRQFGMPAGKTVLGRPWPVLRRYLGYRAMSWGYSAGPSRKWLVAYKKAAFNLGVLAGVAELRRARPGAPEAGPRGRVGAAS